MALELDFATPLLFPFVRRSVTIGLWHVYLAPGIWRLGFGVWHFGVWHLASGQAVVGRLLGNDENVPRVPTIFPFPSALGS